MNRTRLLGANMKPYFKRVSYLPVLVALFILIALGTVAHGQMVAIPDPVSQSITDTITLVAMPQNTADSVVDSIPFVAIVEPSVDSITDYTVPEVTPTPEVASGGSFGASSRVSGSGSGYVQDPRIPLLQQIVALLEQLIIALKK